MNSFGVHTKPVKQRFQGCLVCRLNEAKRKHQCHRVSVAAGAAKFMIPG
jgi:hypothetical protein